jgi:Na+/phosphate symporter
MTCWPSLLSIHNTPDTRYEASRTARLHVVLIQMGIAAGILLVVWLLTFLVHVLMIVSTYRDATRQSSHRTFFCALLVLFAPLSGIVPYLIFGQPQ